MIDVSHLWGTPTVDDSLSRVGNDSQPYGKDLSNPGDDWPWAPAPVAIVVRAGAGQDGADRVTLTWADEAIRNRWLQVTVRATDVTGLAENDVFYVGNAVGESGTSAGDALVNATDEIGARNNPHGPFTPAPKDDCYDYNRDRLVNATDQIISRNNRPIPSPNSASNQRPPTRLSSAAAGDQNLEPEAWRLAPTCQSLRLMRKIVSCRGC
jgi:hypothetical protein